MMFADATSNISTIAEVLTMIVLATGQITIWITLKSPQRREVSFVGDPVEKKEFERLMAENTAVHGQLFSRIGGVERGANEALKKSDDVGSESRRRLHSELQEVSSSVAALTKQADLADTRMFQMDAKLDRLIERGK